MKWSIDYVFEQYGDNLPFITNVRAQYGQLVDAIGTHSMRAIQQVQLIGATFPIPSDAPFKMPTVVVDKIQDSFRWFARYPVYESVCELNNILENFLTLRQTHPTDQDHHVAWIAQLFRKYSLRFLDSFGRHLLRFIGWCVQSFWESVKAGHESHEIRRAIRMMKMPSQPDLHIVLGVHRDASSTEIKTAFRQLVQIYHPDKVPADRRKAATVKLLEIQQAHDILSNVVLHWIYDYRGIKHALYAYQNPARYEQEFPVPAVQSPRQVVRSDDSGRS